MNQEKVEGKFDQVVGKVKQTVGEAVGNQKLADSGAADEVKGAAKEAWGNVKDTASDVRDTASAGTDVKEESLKQRADHAAHEAREKITSGAQNMKNKINEKLKDIRDKDHRKAS